MAPVVVQVNTREQCTPLKTKAVSLVGPPLLCAGYAPEPLYPNYSADFFGGHHSVLRGASPYTHPSLRRTSFRNWWVVACMVGCAGLVGGCMQDGMQ